MTAYGRSGLVSDKGKFSVEIQSVNRKHLEINVVLPKELLRFDADVRRWVASFVARGQVNVKISASFDRFSPLVVMPNLALAKEVKKSWEAIAKEFGIALSAEALLPILASDKDLLLYEEDIQDEEAIRQTLEGIVLEALRHFVVMKEREGAFLYEDIAARFARIGTIIKEIGPLAPGATEKYRQRLVERLKDVLLSSIDDERVMREVCIYAEKIDITEEITRFESHLQQVNKMLHAKQLENQGIGKTLEFIVQELNREINTIGSKSSDIEISRRVIEIKSELERIREQIQNIE